MKKELYIASDSDRVYFQHCLPDSLRAGTPFYTGEECSARICAELFGGRSESPPQPVAVQASSVDCLRQGTRDKLSEPERKKNEMQAVEYMDAFLVIKRKGDWLKLIQYNPAILKNGKLKEWKQASIAAG